MIRILIAAALFLPAALQARETACFHSLRGKVEVLRAGQEEWERAKKGLALAEGDTVRTARRAWCEIIFRDGSFVNLGENSQTLMEKLKTEGKTRDFSFRFLRGKAIWLVAKLKGIGSRVAVRTPSAVCAVRGTDFAVDISTSGDTAVGMFTGEVSISSGDREELVPAGSEAYASDAGLKVEARLSRLMKAEESRYSRIKARVERLRKRLEEREIRFEDFILRRRAKLDEFEERRQKKLRPE